MSKKRRPWDEEEEEEYRVKEEPVEMEEKERMEEQVEEPVEEPEKRTYINALTFLRKLAEVTNSYLADVDADAAATTSAGSASTSHSD